MRLNLSYAQPTNYTSRIHQARQCRYPGICLERPAYPQRPGSRPPQQGRITWSGIPLYDGPSFNANQIYNFRADEILKVTSIDENGDPGNPYNSVWYEIDGKGYTYSGWIQPVETNYQKPKFDIPTSGQVGEITVPYSITRKDPLCYADTAHRVYYGTTHWVTKAVVTRDEKSIWYQIYEFLSQEIFLRRCARHAACPQ